MKTYDYSISLIRVIAMIFIVICHLGTHFHSPLIAQSFNVGVQIFFFIPGYLYGASNVSEREGWLWKRYLRLLIPSLAWLSLAILSSFLGILEFPKTHEIVFLLMNLQGLNFIFTNMQDLFIGPWFFTYVMFCYIVYFLYCKALAKNKSVQLFLPLSEGVRWIIPVLVCVVLAPVGIDLYGLLVFFIGVSFRKSGYFERLKRKDLLVAILLLVASIVAKLIGQKLFNDTLIYEAFLSRASKMILAVTLAIIIRWIYCHVSLVRTLSHSKVNRYLDNISIYVYITHQFYIMGALIPVFELNMPLPMRALLFTTLALTTSTLLWWVGTKASRGIDGLVEHTF